MLDSSSSVGLLNGLINTAGIGFSTLERVIAAELYYWLLVDPQAAR